MPHAELDKHLKKPFTTKNTVLVTNTILQFLLIGIVNLYYIGTTDDFITYILSMTSLMCSLNISTLLPATYEKNLHTRGRYFASSNIFNILGEIAGFTTCASLTYEISKKSPTFALINVMVTLFLVFTFYSQQVDTEGCAYSINGLHDADFDVNSKSDESMGIITRDPYHKVYRHVFKNTEQKMDIDKKAEDDSNDVTSTEEEVTN